MTKGHWKGAMFQNKTSCGHLEDSRDEGAKEVSPAGDRLKCLFLPVTWVSAGATGNSVPIPAPGGAVTVGVTVRRTL